MKYKEMLLLAIAELNEKQCENFVKKFLNGGNDKRSREVFVRCEYSSPHYILEDNGNKMCLNCGGTKTERRAKLR